MLDFLWKTIEDQFANNDLFAGGAILMIAGGIFTVVRGWPRVWWAWIKKQSMVVIDIPDTDDAYEWMTRWLAQDSYAKNRARFLTVKTCRDNKDRIEERPKIIFSPAPGTHYLWYKRRFMILTRERKEPTGSNFDSDLSPVREYLTIRLLGRDRAVALSLLEDAREHVLPKQSQNIQIKQLGGDWRPTLTRRVRSLDTIILPEGKGVEIRQDIDSFLAARTWYEERGIPYRRGYLFYGPPGNGKSSMVLGLAGALKFDIGCINLASAGMSDNKLIDTLIEMPSSTILLLEDIDCIAQGRKTIGTLTFSGLLNALDGVGSPEGQIIIMTTNHPEKLDPALIRPGRCDRKFEFKDANVYQKIQMFKRFYPNHNSMAERFADVCQSDISMAQLQGHFLKHRDCPEEAIMESDNIRDHV